MRSFLRIGPFFLGSNNVLFFYFSKKVYDQKFGREKALGCETGRRLKLGGCCVVLVTYGARLRQLGK